MCIIFVAFLIADCFQWLVRKYCFDVYIGLDISFSLLKIKFSHFISNSTTSVCHFPRIKFSKMLYVRSDLLVLSCRVINGKITLIKSFFIFCIQFMAAEYCNLLHTM
jgi:hypothetical protein